MTGTRALVIGASGGIGGALCAALAARGVAVTGLSRRENGLEITDEASVEAVLGGVTPGVDMILVATGALHGAGQPPEKSLRSLSAAALADQYAVNAIGPALILRHAPRLLRRDRRAVFAAISAKVGSIGDNQLGGWYSYRAAKAALNQIVHTGAIELARSHREAICVTLHPGTVATQFTADHKAHRKHSPEESAENLLTVLENLTPDDTGQFYSWDGTRLPW
ncbi:SDR family NAD(P)-dependent oxidoreductase [uncultured Shimia sp.]|uniref:SDR family NAD(P)-dependent oxidoreductase n=1 Tax=uncultured Shimia sp. TaxID=573152 RepID=UPI0026019EAF|nr:SDR family NAD(P)-dependent oxidoreductase [uncultured Shimia sp.]